MAVKRNLSEPARLTTIGDRLRFLRDRAKAKQVDVATAVGAHPVQLSEWENGKWAPKGPMVIKLAHHYGVRPEWILAGGDFEIIKSSHVPRGTADGTEGRHAKRLARADAFEREMIRKGATDEDADYIRIRSRSFMEGVLSSGGTPELTEDELDEEFEAYLEQNLRLQVEKRIKMRKRSR